MNAHVRHMTLAVSTAVAVAATGLALVAPTATAAATAGASLPFSSVEAESATTDGAKIGPDHTQGTLASEASGRQAVQLNAGQSVEFTLPKAANAVNLSYSVPDGQSGTLAVYVDGQKTATTLPVTSKYSYVDTPWIVGAKTHHLFDNTRALLGADLLGRCQGEVRGERPDHRRRGGLRAGRGGRHRPGGRGVRGRQGRRPEWRR